MFTWLPGFNSLYGSGTKKPVTVDVRHGLALEGLTTNNRDYSITESHTTQGGSEDV